MRVLFLNLTEHLNPKIKHPRHIHPPLDIGFCASLLESSNHETFFMDFAIKNLDLDKVVDFIKNTGIKVVVFKLHPSALPQGLNFLRSLKKRLNILLVAIGPVSTTMPSKLLFENSPVDICIIGEPELALVEVVNRIDRKKNLRNIPSTAIFNKKLFVNNGKLFSKLDEMQMPKHSFFLNKPYSFFYPTQLFEKVNPGFILSSRGCPFNCIFCSPIERVSFGKKYRARKPSSIVDEMEFLIKRGINFIYFEDDIFTFDKKHVINICNEINKRKIKIRWGAQTRADAVDYNLLKLMKKAGCSLICFGIESGSPRILKLLNKGIDVKKIRDTILDTNRLGIKTVGYFIIGNPSETRREIMESIKLAKSLPLSMVQVHFFTPYPGSKIFKTTMGNNMENLNTQDFPTNFSHLSRQDLKRYQKYFYLNFYFTPQKIANYIPRFFNLFNLKSELKLLEETLKYFISK